MKKYEARKLIKSSRFREYFPTLNKETQKAVLDRMNELMQAESVYCDKGNYDHLSNLFAALALYEGFIKQGNNEEEASRKVGEAMWEYVSKTSAPKMKKMGKLKIFMPIMKKFAPKMFSKGSGYGWEWTWHTDTDPKDTLSFECHRCIYATIFKKYNASKLGAVFCHCDILNYGDFDYIDFIRTDTLCITGKPCNFKFVKHPKGEKFERTESI